MTKLPISNCPLSIPERSCELKFAARSSAMLLAMVTSIAAAQTGGDYVIRKSTIDGGGNTAVGDDYRLSGTVGQHDAELLEGDGYVLDGGFWPVAGVLPPVLLPDPSGLDKTRFLSFTVQPGIGNIALRVIFISLHHVDPPYSGGATVPFTAFEGEFRWVGPPAPYVESPNSGIPFQAASLQCAPHYQNWSTVGLLHVTGSGIVPSSVYRAEMVSGACMGLETTPACLSGGSMVSPQTEFRTTRWGDVEGPYNPPSVTVQPDVGDIGALVNKFRNAIGAPIKARAILAGAAGNPFGEVTPPVLAVDLSFSHISLCVDAFRGVPYPYTISSCP